MTQQEQMFLDAIEVLATDIAALQQAVAALQAAPPAPTPTVPHPWRYRATSDDWDALSSWVSSLGSSYSLVDAYAVPACWAEHPGLVEELAAAHQAWIAAVLEQEAGMTAGTGSTEVSAWFTQSLWPCLERLKASSMRYRATSCKNGLHDSDSPATR
jgi:hypothetical protein